jgi:propionyl-CoA carboxylase beta chain
MAIAPKFLSNLAERRKKALAGGGAEKLAARHEKGLLSARERVKALFEPHTFLEMGLHADHDCHDFGLADKSFPGDGVITGVGYISGHPVAVFSQDFTVGGGALGRIHSKKICDLMDYALKAGIPVIGINDSGGARIQEGDDSLSGYGQVFFRNVLASGVIPQISIIAGPCAGGAAYSPALTDFLIMTKKNANMFICGPEVIKAATGQTVTMEEIGSAATNAAVSGNVHFVTEDDAGAIELAKRLLGYLPANNLMDPPHRPTPALDLAPDPGMNELVPADAKAPFDILKVIVRLTDKGDFLEVHKDFAKNLVVGFGRVQGIVAGIVANQSGCQGRHAGHRLVRQGGPVHPLLQRLQHPDRHAGGHPRVHARRPAGARRHHPARGEDALRLRLGHGAEDHRHPAQSLRRRLPGHVQLGHGRGRRFAWPTAEIAVMGAEGAVKILYKKEIAAAKDPKAKEAEYVAEYREKFCLALRGRPQGDDHRRD